MNSGVAADVQPTKYERRAQVLSFAYWAIREVLEETRVAATSELLYNQRSNGDLTRPAARLAVLEELSDVFKSYIPEEKN